MNKKIISENFEEEKQNKISNLEQNKNTKKKSNAQKLVPILIVAIVSLVIILTCVLIAYFQIYKSSKQNVKTLEGVYASSYYSMVDNVNNLSVDISKYSTVNNSQSKIKILNDMMTDCNYVVAGLSTLPINQENVVAATKFFNQINGVCEAYTFSLISGKTLTQEQELLFDKIAIVLNKIKENFNMQSYGMYDTGFSFVDATIFDKTGMNELSASMGNIDSDAVEYPAMIFDGPFSTALETKEIKGLPEEEIDKDTAENYLKNSVFSNRDVKIKFEKETNGELKTFDFLITNSEDEFFAQVSVRGGLLITMSGFCEANDGRMLAEQGIQIAENFANNIGFENMKSVWKELHENVLYVNLAPVENEVVFYPDLVKVKVDLTSGEIVGFEATNYAYNHTDRETEFLLQENECESELGFDYEIKNITKCLIKLESGKEVCCYEFIVEKFDGIYFYYINANNKEIEKIMKLVTIKDVEKLI